MGYIGASTERLLPADENLGSGPWSRDVYLEVDVSGRPTYGPAICRRVPWNAVHMITTSSADAAMTSATMVAFIIKE